MNHMDTHAPYSHTALHIPEIRRCMGKFLDIAALVSSIRVCKLWHNDFIGYLWHTIDLSPDSTINQQYILQHLALLQIHGHLVRKLTTPPHPRDLGTMRTKTLKRLSALTVELTGDPEANLVAFELVQRNMPTLRYLSLSSSSFSHVPLASGQGTRFISANLFDMGHTLEELDLFGVHMTRDEFSSMLKHLPKLVTLKLEQVYFNEPAQQEYFRHPGIKHFQGEIDQLWRRESTLDQEPLLVHFPNLSEYCWTSYGFPCIVPLEILQDGIQRYLPRLTRVAFDGYSPHDIKDILHRCFHRGLESVQLPYHLDRRTYDEVLNQCLTHGRDLAAALVSSFEELECHLTQQPYKDSIRRLKLCNSNFIMEVDVEERTFDGPLIPAWLVNKVLVHSFPYLTVLEIPMHEIEKSQIDTFTPWGCLLLEVLSVRFEGLGTRTMIRQTIGQLKERRKVVWKTEVLGKDTTFESFSVLDNLTVQDKVTRHLLQFLTLRRVWLGSCYYYLP